MDSVVIVKIATALAQASLLTFAVIAPMALTRAISQEYRRRCEIRNKIKKLSGVLRALQPKLEVVTDIGSRNFRSMSIKSDIALYSVQSEFLRLKHTRDELVKLLSGANTVGEQIARVCAEIAKPGSVSRYAIAENDDTNPQYIAQQLERLLNRAMTSIKWDTRQTLNRSLVN